MVRNSRLRCLWRMRRRWPRQARPRLPTASRNLWSVFSQRSLPSNLIFWSRDLNHLCHMQRRYLKAQRWRRLMEWTVRSKWSLSTLLITSKSEMNTWARLQVITWVSNAITSTFRVSNPLACSNSSSIPTVTWESSFHSSRRQARCSN